eukprot:jgi/Botrbrau1/18892/Bobra.177_2s0050.1
MQVLGGSAGGGGGSCGGGGGGGGFQQGGGGGGCGARGGGGGGAAGPFMYGSSSDVVELTDANFPEEVVDSEDLWFVEFFAPWCGHCKNLKPEYDSLATQVRGKVKVGAVDCTVHTSVCQEYGVNGYPTIKFFAADKRRPIEYQGGRDSASLASFALSQWASNQPPPEPVELTSHDIFEIECTGGVDESAAKKLCFIAFLPDILDTKAEGRNAYIQDKEGLEKNGVKVCVLGDLSLLPPEVRHVCEQVMEATSDNNRCVLNFCFPYTSRHDMTQAGCLLTTGSPPVDLLIRTAAEMRLSDFLIWQSGHGTGALHACLAAQERRVEQALLQLVASHTTNGEVGGTHAPDTVCDVESVAQNGSIAAEGEVVVPAGELGEQTAEPCRRADEEVHADGGVVLEAQGGEAGKDSVEGGVTSVGSSSLSSAEVDLASSSSSGQAMGNGNSVVKNADMSAGSPSAIRSADASAENGAASPSAEVADRRPLAGQLDSGRALDAVKVAPQRRRRAVTAPAEDTEIEWAAPRSAPSHEEEHMAGCNCCQFLTLPRHAACGEPVPGLQAMIDAKKARDAAARGPSAVPSKFPTKIGPGVTPRPSWTAGQNGVSGTPDTVFGSTKMAGVSLDAVAPGGPVDGAVQDWATSTPPAVSGSPTTESVSVGTALHPRPFGIASQNEAKGTSLQLPAEQDVAKGTAGQIRTEPSVFNGTAEQFPAVLDVAKGKTEQLPAEQNVAKRTLEQVPAGQNVAKSTATQQPAMQNVARSTAGQPPAVQNVAEGTAAQLPGGQNGHVGTAIQEGALGTTTESGLSSAPEPCGPEKVPGQASAGPARDALQDAFRSAREGVDRQRRGQANGGHGQQAGWHWVKKGHGAGSTRPSLEESKAAQGGLVAQAVVNGGLPSALQNADPGVQHSEREGAQQSMHKGPGAAASTGQVGAGAVPGALKEPQNDEQAHELGGSGLGPGISNGPMVVHTAVPGPEQARQPKAGKKRGSRNRNRRQGGVSRAG